MLSTPCAWLIHKSFALVQVRKRLRQTEILILDEASHHHPSTRFEELGFSMPQVIKQNQGVPVCQALSPLNDRATSQLGYSFVNAMVPKPTATLNPSGEHAFGRLLRPSLGPAILHPHTRWPGRLWWAAGGALRGFHAAAAGTSHNPGLSGRGLAAASGPNRAEPIPLLRWASNVQYFAHPCSVECVPDFDRPVPIVRSVYICLATPVCRLKFHHFSLCSNFRQAEDAEFKDVPDRSGSDITGVIFVFKSLPDAFLCN